MDTYGIFTEPGTIRFERLLPGPIERVWAYLTEADKRGQWLALGEMELRVGGRVELIFNNATLTPHEEQIPEKYREYGDESRLYGTITQLEPPRLLSYTWEEPAAEDSEVTFELEPHEEEGTVLLVLTHRRLGSDREILRGVGAGWHTHLGILNDKLRGQEPQPFWAVHMELEKVYGQRLDEAF